MSAQLLFLALPALVAICILVQLRTGRIRLYMAPKEWQFVDRNKDEGRFWLFIIVEGLLVLILIWQAIAR